MSPSSSKPGGQIQAAVTASSNVAYAVYRAFFAGMMTHVVPAHTRDAVFQLFCDLRANTVKDRKFLTRHAKALAPKTNIGWLAIAAGTGYMMAVVLFLSTATLVLSVVGLSAILAAIMFAGMFLGSALGFLAFTLAVSAILVAMVGTVSLGAYGTTTASLEVMKYITTLVFGPMGQQQTLPAANSDNSLLEPSSLSPSTYTSNTTVTPLPPIKTTTNSPRTKSPLSREGKATTSAVAKGPHTPDTSADPTTASTPEPSTIEASGPMFTRLSEVLNGNT